MAHYIIKSLIVVTLMKFSVGKLKPTTANSVCDLEYSTHEIRHVPYEETYKKRVFGMFYRIQTRINYRFEPYTVWHPYQKCCSGYFEHYSECRPVCEKTCENGKCYKPNECLCNSGYRKDQYQDNICVPICNNDCIHGKCTEPNICTCNSEYDLDSDGFTCSPICKQCPENSVCTAPNVCQCIANYQVETVKNGSKVCSPICGKKCFNGDCVAPDVCQCKKGYVSVEGEAFTCMPKCSNPCIFGTCTAPETCTCYYGYNLLEDGYTCHATCDSLCVNGECIAPNTCTCFEGYGFTNDSDSICKPICNSTCENGHCVAPEVCSCNEGYQMNNNSECEPICRMPCYNGKCEAPEDCSCFDGYKKSLIFPSICEPICHQKCENGQCTSPEICTCNEGYQMNNNSDCEPICSENCFNGVCTAPEFCTCFEGYRKTVSFCEPICEKCENAHCTSPGECTCDQGFEKDEISNDCVAECKCIHGSCRGKNRTCVCEDGYRLSDDENSTKCVPVCDNGCIKGECIAPQECKCHDNYIINDDSRNNTCVSVCGEECVHGLCLPEQKACNCFYGWTGISCEIPLKCAAAFEDALSGEIFNSFNETLGNETKLQTEWEGPICSKDCLHVDANQTECFNESLNDNLTTMICFLNIDSDCNVVSAEGRGIKKDSIFWSKILYGLYALIGSTILFVVLFLFKFYKGHKKSTVSRSNSFLEGTDCLMEEEGSNL